MPSRRSRQRRVSRDNNATAGETVESEQEKHQQSPSPTKCTSSNATNDIRARRGGERDAVFVRRQQIVEDTKTVSGVRFDEFEVQKAFGSAENGTVLACTTRGVTVGLKVLHSSKDTSTPTTFVDEFQLLQQLPWHWNIITVLETVPSSRLTEDLVQHLPDAIAAAVCHGGRTRYACATGLVMEAFPMTLRQYIESKSGTLPTSDVLNFASQIVDGALHLIDHGIVHSNLSLDNLLIDPSCKRLVISDFSCARQRGSGPTDMDDALRMHPFHNTTLGVGNTAHLAPEVVEAVRWQSGARGQSDGPHVDSIVVPLAQQPSFAVGVLLFELALNGKHPFTAPLSEASDTNQSESKEEGAESPGAMAGTVEERLKQLQNATTSRYAMVAGGLIAPDPAHRMPLSDALRLLRGVSSRKAKLGT